MKLLYVWAEARTRLSAAGGDVVHVLETVRALRALGHEVGVVSGGDARFNEQAKSFYRRARQLVPRISLRAGRELYEILQDRRTLRDLLNRLSQEPYDGVYERYSLFHLCGVTAARRHGLPVILEVNGTVRETEDYFGLSLRTRATRTERVALDGADAIVVVTEALRDELIAGGIQGDKIVVLPNGVDEALFSPSARGDAVRRQLGLGNHPVIGFVGSFSPWHDLLTVIEAFETLSGRHQARLLLVGEGGLRDSIEQVVRERGLQGRVILPGRVTHDSVPEYIAAMDVAVAPYPHIRRFHFSPIKLFEYMAMGRAVVTVALGDLPRMIAGGETGLFYEPGNARSLASAMSRLLDDPELRARLGTAARAWVLRERTWTANARRIADLFRTCRDAGRRERWHGSWAAPPPRVEATRIGWA